MAYSRLALKFFVWLLPEPPLFFRNFGRKKARNNANLLPKQAISHIIARL
jgi:hypothetical protein